MTKASARPLEGSTSHDLMAGEARVATRPSKRFYGLLACVYQTQTNVWELDRASRHLNARVVARGVALWRRPRKAPLCPPGPACTGGDLPQFFPHFLWNL